MGRPVHRADPSGDDPSVTKTIGECRVCGAAAADPFFRLAGVPVQDGLLWPSRLEALAAPTGDLELVFCPACGYIGNRAFDPSKLRYDPTYDISLHHSPAYRQFIGELAERLAREHHLAGKSVLEIGCGKGDFLRALCERAGCRGIGFDPTSIAPDGGAGTDRVRIVRELYSERFAHEPADLVCCRHLLDAIGDVRGFLRTLRRTLGTRTESTVYFEVPDGSVVFRRKVVWNAIYEHCSYFTAPSLDRLFTESGFDVRSITACFQDEYLGLEASPSLDFRSGEGPGEMVARLAGDVETFAELYRETTARWADWLQDLRRAGRRAVLWGAGARAVAFLSALQPGEEVPYLVDINPHRQGLFLPRTGQPVLAPESLSRDPPDIVLITNPAFAEEIRAQASGLGVRGDVLVLD